MFAALALLLLFIFALGFWILKESKVKLWVKVSIISSFFCFCVIMSTALTSFLGWSADSDDLPRKVTLRHVVIKEPNHRLGIYGSIHFLIEQKAPVYDSWVFHLFGYKAERSEPRLFKLPYSRKMHEMLQAEVMPKLSRGQMVTGEFTKGKKGKGGAGGGEGDGEGGNGKGGKGKGKGKGGKGQGQGGQGYGGDSPGADWQFHVLPPSVLVPKGSSE